MVGEALREKLERAKSKGKIVLYIVIGVLLFLFVLRLKRKIQSQVTIVRNNGRCVGIPTDETIFVAITSSQSELDRTVKRVGELFDASACPNRVFVGVCQTGGGEKRRDGGWKSLLFMDRYKRVNRKHDDAFDNNIRVINEPVREAKGFSNAMNMIQTYLYRGERFFMTLSNTLSVVQNWDSLLVEDMKKCRLKSRKPIITQSAYHERSADKSSLSTNPTFLRATGWSENGTPMIEEYGYKNPPVRPFKSLFYTSSLSFALGSVAREVKYDPWYQHVPMHVADWPHAIRLWTNGWDFYSPSKKVAKRNDFVDRKSSKDYEHYDPLEEKMAYGRLWCFLGFAPPGSADLRGYEVGLIRTEDEYRSFSGVDWKERSMYPHSRVGMSLTDKCKKGSRHPFESEEVVAKYGSWTDFFEITDYRPNDVQRVL